MVAQANFPHKQLQGLNGGQLQDKLYSEREINWNDLPTWQKRGACIKKIYFERNGALRSVWDVDLETPIFSQDREYVEQYVCLEERYD